GDFLAMTKPRVVLMVLTSILVGFYLGARGVVDYWVLLQTLVATALTTGGTLALNQYLEREVDAQMARTRLRPLPDGRLKPAEALGFGVILTTVGLLYATFAVNVLTGLLTALIVGAYLFLYTPLKVKTEFCNLPGAVAGALPPVVGWAAATGTLEMKAWVLFAIMFVWQFPHLLAIGWLYKEEYAQAGVRHIVGEDANPRGIGRQIVINCLALLVLGLMPTLVGLAGAVYFIAALAVGIAFLACGIGAAFSLTESSARRLLVASLVHLPVLLLLMVIDKVPT
ncbi:MAG TPA: heme o synthase, partial [Nitrospinota bacterium]|nr:heme o synthase [Nitrospinota bacterium]